MAYIDYEKLIAKINQLAKTNQDLKPNRFTQGIAAGYGDVLSAIRSLKQEQLEQNVDMPRDNWEYVKEFCDKFGRIPEDMDELEVLVSYVISERQKWSKEDEEMLKIIDGALFKASVNAGLGAIRCPYDDARDWLKSFGLKFHWKPSKEQIEALEYAEKGYRGSRDDMSLNAHLYQLLCDLKKL